MISFRQKLQQKFSQTTTTNTHEHMQNALLGPAMVFENQTLAPFLSQPKKTSTMPKSSKPKDP